MNGLECKRHTCHRERLVLTSRVIILRQTSQIIPSTATCFGLEVITSDQAFSPCPCCLRSSREDSAIHDDVKLDARPGERHSKIESQRSHWYDRLTRSARCGGKVWRSSSGRDSRTIAQIATCTSEPAPDRVSLVALSGLLAELAPTGAPFDLRCILLRLRSLKSPDGKLSSKVCLIRVPRIS